MRPRQTQNDFPRGNVANPEKPTKLRVTEVLSEVQFPQIKYISLRKFVGANRFSSGLSVNAPPSHFPIIRVILFCAQFQMPRVHTCWDRGSRAGVKNAEAFRNWSSCQNVSRDVRSNVSTKRPPSPDLPIAENRFSGHPQPALEVSTPFNLGPKSIGEAARKSLSKQVTGSNFNHLRSLSRLGYWPSGTFSLYQTVNQGGN